MIEIMKSMGVYIFGINLECKINNIVKSILLLLLLGGMQLEANEYVPKIRLEKGEKKFKLLEAYRLKDYHFHWKIIYMDISHFYTEASDGKCFKLPEKFKVTSKIKLGKATKPLSKKTELWLAKAILKKKYFWKKMMPPSSIYAFTTLRFMERGDDRYKAVTGLQDISDMLGKIDTMAEWQLWFYATRTQLDITSAYSYKKVGKLHRIRFASVNPFTCDYHEYFNYYDDFGKLVKSKKLKEYAVKGCAPIMI